MNELIPVTILTGFLGSGKTTLLANLIKQVTRTRFAVLVNEIGEISIDGSILRDAAQGTSAEIHEVSHGLVAYSEDESFVPLMKRIAERKHSIDHFVVETSGLALPTAVIQTLRQTSLSQHFVLDATIAVVDTPRLLNAEFAAGTAIGELFARQLECADVVVLNKIDELDEQSLLSAEHVIRADAPAVRFIELAVHARLDPLTAIGLRLNQPTHTLRGSSLVSPAAAGLTHDHVHSGLDPHQHGIATHEHVHEHDPGWLSFVLRSDHGQAAQDLAVAVRKVAATEPLLRAKGFAYCGGQNQPMLLQAVQGRVAITWTSKHPPQDGHSHEDHNHLHHDAEHWPDNNEHSHSHSSWQAEIVFIGYHINRINVASIMSEFTGTQWE